MPRSREPDDRAWEQAALLVLHPARPEDVTWTLIALRGQLMPGHPVLGLLEERRAHLRGERSALTETELAPLYLRIVDILLLVE